MFGSVVIEVIIGLIGVFLVFSLVVSGIREVFATAFQTRAKGLWTKLSDLLDGEPEEEVADPWGRVQAAAGKQERRPQLDEDDGRLSVRLARHPFISGRDRSTLPTGKMKLHRINAPDFTRSLLDLLVEGKNGSMMGRINEGISDLKESSPGLYRQLKALLDQGADDIDKLRGAIEAWYDSQMASLSTWYRRQTHWVAFAIGIAVAFLFNINAIGAAEELWQNTSLRDTAVATASAQLSEDLSEEGICADASDVLACVETETAKFVDVGFPFGWSCSERDGCKTLGATIADAWDQAWSGSNTEVALRFAGWILAAAAFSMGSTFWYDLLRRVTGFRSALAGAKSS